MAAPTVFISYAWESDEHRAWVREFATRLRGDGIDAKIDQWEAVLGDQLPAFMEGAIRSNDFVLIVCTPNYRDKSDHRTGGVGYEGDIMTAEVFTKRNHRKFIPILRSGKWAESGPSWLNGKVYADLRGDPYNEQAYIELRNTLHGFVPSAPPLGPVPPSKYLKASEVGTFVKDAAEFEQRSKSLIGRLQKDPLLAPLLNGIHLPVCLPKCRVGDYGHLVEEQFLPRVKDAYEAKVQNGRFENGMLGKLAGDLGIADDSHQERLIEKMATGPVVALLFPVALQGYSVEAAREQMATLPDGFVLSGVLDTCIAFIAYPEVLGACHAPTSVCAGTTWQSTFSLCFHPGETHGGGSRFLRFCIADHGLAMGSHSPGMLYIG